MKVAVISDTHLGFKWNSERREDSFKNAEEAFNKALDEADIILLPGDIFDTKTPSQEVFSKAFNIFEKVVNTRGDYPSVKGKKWEEGKIPVVAIHGTHERRSRGYVNPIQLLDDAGVLIHLHNDSVTVEKDGEKLNVFGMSGVPERYASEVLKKWSPKPKQGDNILMLHQSVENFVYTEDGKHVKLTDIPKDFDFIIDGHIHWKNLEFQSRDVPLMFPGSTITTQITKREAERDKGFVMIDTDKNETKFIPLKEPREVFYDEIDVSSLSGEEVVEKTVSLAEENAKNLDKKPLQRIVLKGEKNGSFSLSEIRKKIESSILSIDKKTYSKEEGEEALEKIDVEKAGLEEISKNIQFKEFEDFFQKLSEGKNDEVIERLVSMDLSELKKFLEKTKEKSIEDEDGNSSEEKSLEKKDRKINRKESGKDSKQEVKEKKDKKVEKTVEKGKENVLDYFN